VNTVAQMMCPRCHRLLVKLDTAEPYRCVGGNGCGWRQDDDEERS